MEEHFAFIFNKSNLNDAKPSDSKTTDTTAAPSPSGSPGSLEKDPDALKFRS